MNISHMFNNSSCTGCELCANVCPTKAISFVPNQEGFLYPVIDFDKCISCSRCSKLCPAMNPSAEVKEGNGVLSCYAGYHKNSEILKQSASGGAASALMETMLKQGGDVCGVTYSENFREAHYEMVSSLDEISKFRGSKYTGTRKQNIYQIVRNALNKGKKVLFIGLPCEVAALKKLTGDSDDLITSELICHGPTSEKVIGQYLSYLEKKEKCGLKTFTIRYKKYGWTPACVRAEFQNARIQTPVFLDTAYGYAFSQMNRASCEICAFKGNHSEADLTMGDYWGAEKTDQCWNPEGVSVILVRSPKGQSFVNSMDNMQLYPISYDGAIVRNPAIYRPCKKPGRKVFTDQMNSSDIFEAMKQTASFKTRVIMKIRGPVYNLKKFFRLL